MSDIVERLTRERDALKVQNAAQEAAITRQGERIGALKAENERMKSLVIRANEIISDELDRLVQCHSVGGRLHLGPHDAGDIEAGKSIETMSAWVSEAFIVLQALFAQKGKPRVLARAERRVR